jgi:hypothetical protein
MENGQHVLEQLPFGPADEQQISNRIRRLEERFPEKTEERWRLRRAQDRAAKHHQHGHDMIVLSRELNDQIEWKLLGNPGFRVEVHPHDPGDGAPPNPLAGFPKGDNGSGSVLSGVPLLEADHQHYKYTVITDDGAVLDPDWYTGP